MTKHQKIISTNRGGLCKSIVDQQERRLEKLWDKTESKDREMVIGFAILDGDVEVSIPMEGGRREVKQRTTMNAVAASNKYDIENYDMVGHIHTHPAGADTMPKVMSPSDFNMHIKLSDRIDKYNASLVLTNFNNQHKLFGLTTDNTPTGLAGIQRDLAEMRSDFKNHDEIGRNPYEILEEMEDLMLEHWKPCSHTF